MCVYKECGGEKKSGESGACVVQAEDMHESGDRDMVLVGDVGSSLKVWSECEHRQSIIAPKNQPRNVNVLSRQHRVLLTPAAYT